MWFDLLNELAALCNHRHFFFQEVNKTLCGPLELYLPFDRRNIVTCMR